MDNDYTLSSEEMKEVIDLEDFLVTLGKDRPPLGIFLRDLGISPQAMSHTIIASTKSAALTLPDTAIQIVNNIFKHGVTVGYKYAIKKQFEKEFGLIDSELQSQREDGIPSGGENE